MTTPHYTEATPLIITTERITKRTIPTIVAGAGYLTIGRFVQDGDCGFVQLDGAWHFVATIEAAQLIIGARQ